MQRLKVEHVRLNTRNKEPLQYLIIHALCVNLKEMEAFTMQPLHQGTDGDRGYFDLANFLRIGCKSAVMFKSTPCRPKIFSRKAGKRSTRLASGKT